MISAKMDLETGERMVARNASNNDNYTYHAVSQEPNQQQEIISGAQPKRNWKGIFIAILVILAICAIVTVVIVLVTRAKAAQSQLGSPITFNEFLHGSFHEQTVRYNWLDERRLGYHDDISNMVIMQIDDDGKLHQDHYDSLIHNWNPSYNADYIAFGVNTEELYRHSAKAVYTIVLLGDRTLKTRYVVGSQKLENRTTQKLRLFKWSPRGNDFAFVFQNDIYYRPSPDDPSSDAIRITTNGREGEGGDDVVSGVADWLYEEEIFHNDDAMWWSPDGAFLAFATFDNRQVRRMPIVYYPDPGTSDELYPQWRKVAYPKVGERLPNVTLSVWDKARRRVVAVEPPVEVQWLGEYYLFSVSWPNITVWNDSQLRSDDGEPPLMAVWANRAQNLSYISLCGVRSGTCVLNYVANKNVIKSSSIWVEPMDFRLEYAVGDRYFALLPSLQKDGYYYKHIASVEVLENGLAGKVHYLTEGEWEVIQIVGHNAEKSIIFFTAANPLPRRKNLFSVSTAVSPVNTSSIRCLTCWMEQSHKCTNFNAGFSKDGDHHVLTCDGPSVPFSVLRKASTNETLHHFVNNTFLEEFAAKKALPVVKYESVDLGDGYEATARILFPPGYKESTNSELFPMVQFVYAGPNSQYVWEQWYGMMAFETYLASNRRYIVVSFDGRGSSNRGSKYKRPVYRNLGTYEVQDQITAGRTLASTINAIDSDRMAVWGWSYGGFAVTAMVERGAFNLYKCAAAVAPVTDFRYYDAAYIERYMGLYSDPEAKQAYSRTNLLLNVSQIANGEFLLIHGTADDNVHFQNSAMLAEALTSRNVQFTFMPYTNGDHSLGNSRTHLHTLLDNFFQDCFKKPTHGH